MIKTYEKYEIIKTYEELWRKIRDLISSVTKNSADFNSDDELALNKTTEIDSMIIVVRAVFHENNKYYLQVFVGECMYIL